MIGQKHTISLVDSHAHLDSSDYEGERAAVIARAFTAGIAVITVGSDLPSSEKNLRLARRHRHLWAAIGVHPHNAETLNKKVFDRLMRLSRNQRVVAIGEIGLDFYRDLCARDVQRVAFRNQLELSRKLDLPIIVHNREATRDVLSILREVSSSYRGAMHCFLGDRALADEFLELGFHLGIGGSITFEKNDALRKVVKQLPLDRILLETDCPYLAPVPYRGKRNEPCCVRYVADTIAEVKRISVEAVAETTTENAATLFNLWQG